MSNSTGPRIAYGERTNWLLARHYHYGPQCHLHDVDNISMWIEHTSGNLAALCEFKNKNERIEVYKYKQLISLANNSNIPCFILVGYENEGPSFFVYPLNDICKKILPGSGRWMSEVTYIKFLHFIRKIKVDPEILVGKSDIIPQGLKCPIM